MKLQKEEFLFFLKNRRYTIPVVITVLIGYAFTLTNPSVSIDDLSMNRYLYGEFLKQGRLTSAILQRILGLDSFEPFVLDFLAVLCFFFAAITFCVLFRRVTNDGLHFYSYVLFSCLFISYPLISEIFIYMGAGLIVCFGYLMVAFSLLFVYNWLVDRKKKDLLIATALLIIISSGYESLDVVYICGVMVLLLMRLLFTEDKKYKKLKINMIDGLKAAIPLALGIALEFIISMAVISILGLELSVNGENMIIYFFNNFSFLFLLKKAILGVIFRYLYMSLSYFPIMVLDLAGITAIIMMIVYGIRKKSFTIVLLFIGILSTLVMLTFLQGSVTPYRACQVFGFFVAFVFMLVLHNVFSHKYKHGLKTAVGVLACLLVFYQASDLNKWFYVDYLRYQDDVNVVNTVATQLISNYDIKDKPVVFTGIYKVSDKVKKYTQLTAKDPQYRLFKMAEKHLHISTKGYLNVTDVIYISDIFGVSYISWGVNAFHEVNTELLKLFSYEGYDLKQGTKAMYDEALKSAKTMKNWPEKGSIKDMGDYILVNFGV